ncbi:SRPBCC domain-containing protein [Streptomyces sp. NPDC002845]
MTGSIEQGISQTHGNIHILHFLVRLPRPMETVWPALATRDGLAAWFTPADLLEPHLGGAITLRDLGEGRITAWDVERVAEYTVDREGRLRFHLEPAHPSGTTLRFTNEYRGAREPPPWRERFERLLEVLGAG